MLARRLPRIVKGAVAGVLSLIAATGLAEQSGGGPGGGPDRGWVSRESGLAVCASTIVLPGEAIENDLLAIGGDTQIYGVVSGDVVALGANIYVFGRLDGSATAILGRVIVRGDSAIVSGDATVIGGSVSLQDGGSVLGRTRIALPAEEPHERSYLRLATRPEMLLLRLGLAALWTLAALAAALTAPAALVSASASLRRRPGAMLLVGALFHVSVLLAAILCTALIALVMGLPLLGLLLAFLLVVHALAMGVSLHALGERLTERSSSDAAAARVSSYAKILIGALVLAASSLVPVLGELVWCAAVLAGSGSILATRARPATRP